MEPLTISLLAAGLSSRYGSAKTLEPVGPGGESLLDYAVYDALASGFGRVAFVVRRVGEEALRSRFRARFGDAVPVAFVRQELWPLPGGRRAPGSRMKPWGTGHAVLRLAEAVRGPFAVANADDFYGRSSYRDVASFLAEDPGGPRFCLVGFRLAATLSTHGGVSRAVCDVDASGRLVGLEEVLDVQRGEEGVIVGRTPAGRTRTLQPDALVSMNLWGFTPAVFPMLEARFAAFLDKHGEDPQREFLLSDAVGDMVGSREATVQVLPADAPWFGMTFREDRDRVEARIAALVEAGEYPPSLREAMRGEEVRAAAEAAAEAAEEDAAAREAESEEEAGEARAGRDPEPGAEEPEETGAPGA